MMLDDATIDRLAAVRTIELTTFGRRRGQPARIEIWWFQVDGRFVITGTPGPRDWYANVVANPAVIIHVNGDDYPGSAVPIHDPDFRRRVFTDPGVSWYRTQSELDALVSDAPMIEVTF